MTDYHKLLGVEKNASKEEIKKAYEKQVEKIKKEVVNEKRLNQFIKMFDEAYEALNNLEEKNLINENKASLENATVILNPKELQKKQEANEEKDNNSSKNNSKRKGKSAGRKKNSFIEKGFFKRENKKKNKNDKGKDTNNKLKEKKEDKFRSQKEVKKNSTNNDNPILRLLMLPFKILALPIIAILSVIILVLQIISIISWIATKILIVGSISVGAIHLYQVKLGQTIDYNILTLAGAVLIVSFFLPYILKILLSIFKSLNDGLKDFVF